MAGYLLCFTRHFTKFTTARFVLESIGECKGVVLLCQLSQTARAQRKIVPPSTLLKGMQVVSEQLSDVTVEWFTRQFKEKFETDYSIVLCRPECQLAQQTSLTPSSIKVHWYLTLPNASCQHVTFCTVNFLICSSSQKNLRVSVSETAFGCIWRL